jgi:hypothetical protein
LGAVLLRGRRRPRARRRRGQASSVALQPRTPQRWLAKNQASRPSALPDWIKLVEPKRTHFRVRGVVAQPHFGGYVQSRVRKFRNHQPGCGCDGWFEFRPAVIGCVPRRAKTATPALRNARNTRDDQSPVLRGDSQGHASADDRTCRTRPSLVAARCHTSASRENRPALAAVRPNRNFHSRAESRTCHFSFVPDLLIGRCNSPQRVLHWKLRGRRLLRDNAPRPAADERSALRRTPMAGYWGAPLAKKLEKAKDLPSMFASQSRWGEGGNEQTPP